MMLIKWSPGSPSQHFYHKFIENTTFCSKNEENSKKTTIFFSFIYSKIKKYSYLQQKLIIN